MEKGQRACLYSLTLASLLAASALTGCSGRDWGSHFYMFHAEQAFSKAYVLRTKRGTVPYETRLQLYRTACEFFWKAFELNPHTFTLNRIESAAESCLRTENYQREKTFREFEERYIWQHPDEAEYGDAGAYMSVE